MTRGGLAVWMVLVCVSAAASRVDAAMTAEQRLRILEEQLKAAQDEIRSLRREVEEQKQERAAEAPPAAPPAAKAEAKPAELPKWLSSITPFGDVRIRYEGFFNQPHEEGDVVHARNRARFRARIGLTYKYSDELAATVRLATGNPDDPISTNVTFDDVFDRKNINLDWAYLTLAPGDTFGWRPGVFTLQGGKFGLPHFRVGEMIFDDDVSPEGFSEKVAVLGKPVGYLQQVNVYAVQWTFAEISNSQDGWMFGGQVAPRLKLGDAEVEVGLAQYWWLNPDFIARDLNTNSALFNSNLIEEVVVDDETEIVGYVGAFNQTNMTIAALFPDVVLGQPLRLSMDWVYNWQAATDADWGVQGAIRLGLPKKRGDWAVTLLYEYLEREAAISSLVWSDFGFGGTNVQGPMLGLEYQLLDPLTLTARGYFVNYIDRPAGSTNSTLIRTQVDAMVRF